MLFNCKFCGGELEITEGMGIITCKYCRTAQTLPKTESDGAKNLFNRANSLRRRNEFDKAEALYEKIIEQEPTEPEAYWGLVLSKYGIEYVEDPSSGEMMPTCHRASYDSIIADGDYKSAIEYADEERRALYEEQAREIDRIQRDILAVAQNEEPYDVFICYKETDENGRRTHDSVIANDIYYQLTEEGFKVFYAAITLEGKLGSAYEPIIFAALNSAKVMLAVGSKPEYFNAVWVKNEWSRFLKIIKKDRTKLLIPCYRDMDAYELPDEFAHLQAQDMSKIGFINDVVRGIKKVIVKDEPKSTVVKETVVKETIVKEPAAGETVGAGVQSLLKRVFIFLEDGDFKSADEYCEKVLDIDPENATAYLGKLMAELKVKKRDELKKCSTSFEDSGNYQRTLRYADDALKNELGECIKNIVYLQGVAAFKAAKTEKAFKDAGKTLKSVAGYKDADTLIALCAGKAIEAKSSAEEERRLAEEAKKAAEEKKRKEEEEKRIAEQKKAEQARAEERARARKRIKNRILLAAAVCLIIVAVIVANTVVIPTVKTNNFISEYGREAYDKFGLVAEGEYITFGHYEQDADESNGKEAIEWLVLEVKDGKALLVSRYALDWMRYNDGDYGTWEKSTVRNWLNSEFLYKAFSVDERIAIQFVNVPVDGNSVEGENATADSVFLLSRTEVDTYLKSKSDKKCERTAYAVKRGAYEYKHNLTNKNNCIWWLRTSIGEESAYCINLKGEGYTAEKAAQFAVRPAIWIDIK